MYNQLQTRLHTKEFPGLEVEGKWLLRTCNPVPTILHFVEDVQLDRWYPYVRTKSMGHRSTEVSFLAIQNFFFGFVNKQNAWEQVAMAPKYPGRDLYLLIFKNPPKNTFALENDLFAPIVMMRMEEKKQGLFPYNTLMDHIHARAPNAQYVGCLQQEKCSFLITNQDTYRNFSVTADYCCVGSKVLSQLEIEYKGRSGNWLPIPDYEAIIKEYDALNTILRTYYSCQIGRSFQTKFDWLAKENYITGREIDGI